MAWSEATQPPATEETRRVDNPPGRQSLGRRQCIAKTSDGDRCKKPPSRGGTVCLIHGGSTRLARLQAQRVLLSMVEPAAAALTLAVQRCEYDPERKPDEPKICLVHGVDGCPEWGVRVNAAKALLDRAGFGPQAKLTLESSTNTDDFDKMDKQRMADELEYLSQRLRLSEHATIDVTAEPQTHDAEGAA